MTFRTRSFFSALATAAVTLTVAVTMISWSVRRSVGDRIERALVNEARLAAETLSHRRPATPEELDAEADALGRLVSARVTFIAADGTVVGDSQLNAEELRTVENHKDRPEVQQARRDGLGVSRRYSATLDIEMLYVAVTVRNETAPMISEIRLALPLTDIRDELAALRRTALVAAAAGLGTALLLAWAASLFLSGRVRTHRRSGEPLCGRRLLASGEGLRHGRDRDGGARARRVDPRHRPPRGRARHGSRAHGGDPRRHGRRASSSSTRRGTCSWPTTPRADAAAAGRRRKAATTSRSSATRTSPRRSARRSRGGEEGQSLELPLPHGVIVDGRAAHRYAPSGRPAPSSCCTTSPTCGAPIVSAATSSPTSRTSCARRSPRSRATSKRCSTAAPTAPRRGAFSRSSRGTRCAWSDW